MDYIEVDIVITPWSEETAEIVMAEIDQLGFESYSLEESSLKAYIKSEIFSEHNLRTLLSLFSKSPDFKLNYKLNYIPYKNWNEEWESSFTPVVIGNRCTIKASFHKNLSRSRYNITIDPKMAFGTGHHNTTALMTEFLLDESVKERVVLDMGTGTGILAILAAKMGAHPPVHAIDIDPIAVQSAIENSRKNRISKKVVSLCGDASLLQANKYDLILANINRNILLEDISTYSRSLKAGGKLIISGFYSQDMDVLIKQGEKYNLIYSESRLRDNWAAISMIRK